MIYQQKVQKKMRVFDYEYTDSNYVKTTSYKWAYYGELFRYRYDPVPFTRKRKNPVRPCVRHMRTTQERKMWFKYKEYVRGKRSCNSLPSYYDDVWHARREKGWKRSKNKKHQWERR